MTSTELKRQARLQEWAVDSISACALQTDSNGNLFLRKCDSLICSNRVYPNGMFLKPSSRCCDGVRTTLTIARLAAAQAAIKD